MTLSALKRAVYEPRPLRGARDIARTPTPLNRERLEDGPVWLWGVHASLAALANPARRIERVVATRNAAARLPAGVDALILDPDAIDGMLPPGAVHQGLAVRAWPLEPLALEDACAPPDGRPVVVLDQITDPQNVGAIFRTAAAFNARAVAMQDRKSPPLTGVLAKAAAGAVDLVPHVRVVNVARALEALTEMGYLTVGLAGEAGMDLRESLHDERPVALALGAEGKGLRDGVLAACERAARIPIDPRMESLNVSNAAAIALYACAERSERAPSGAPPRPTE